ncbi:Rib/alpha-like domain-containing protein [Limosilactobacillus caviae]|uniref:Gram-positive cocci surface proteins LPxTG domain-containing protein n=1 Tax=Limosilactobacillus caviae TaxID=1769424 RepID=A0ABQ2C2A6_9LACO|nr:Rib/alpha-like domain-containing protein [Limosilactobacillus caviae]GGI62170.1 hypothetical protein GCM10011459_00040 [Limosilactobacillus caviae]
MLSKNNRQEQFRKQEPKKQRFAIKKLTVGVASVLIGFTFMGMNASADTDTTSANNTQPASESSTNGDTDSNSSVVPIKTPVTVTQDLSTVPASNRTVVNTDTQNEQSQAATPAQKEDTVKPTETTIASPMADKYEQAVKDGLNQALFTMPSAASTNATTTLEDQQKTLRGTQQQEVADWQGLVNALNDSNIGTIKLTSDITVANKGTNVNGINRPQPLVNSGKMNLTGSNISGGLDIDGQGHAINFGANYLSFTTNNQKDSNPWDIAFKNLTINADGYDNSWSTLGGAFSPIYMGGDDIRTDLLTNNKVTFENVTADVKNGAFYNTTMAQQTTDNPYTTVTFKGNNNITCEAVNVKGNQLYNYSSAVSASHIIFAQGTNTVFNVSSAKTNNDQNAGGNILRAKVEDETNDTAPAIDIQQGATVTLNGQSKDVKGMLVNSAITGTVQVDGNLIANMADGHSMAIWAGNLNIGKTGVVNINTKQSNDGSGANGVTNYDGYHFAPISLGVGFAANITNADSNVLDNQGKLTIVRTGDNNQSTTPLISFGSGSGLGAKWDLNVHEGATLDLQDSAQQSQSATKGFFTNTPKYGLVTMWGGGTGTNNSYNHVTITNPKYVNFQRTGNQTGTLLRLENQNNNVTVSSAGGKLPFAQWDEGNKGTGASDYWYLKNIQTQNNWGDNAISGFTQAGNARGQNKNGEIKFLHSNGQVNLAQNQAGLNSYQFIDGTVTQGQPADGVKYETPYLNRLLNNFNWWTPQRVAMGSSLEEVAKPTDSDQYQPVVKTIDGNTRQTLNDLTAKDGISGLRTSGGTITPDLSAIKSVTWYDAATDATEWNNLMNGQAAPTNPTGNLKTSDKSAWAKVTYTDGSIDFANIPLNITVPMADTYTPSYNSVTVEQGQSATADPNFVGQDGKETTMPAGSTFTTGTNTPSWANVDPSTGVVTVNPSIDVTPGAYNVPVTVTYPDKSTDETTVPVIVTKAGQTVIWGENGAVVTTVDASSLNAHETSENSQVLAPANVVTAQGYKLTDGKLSTTAMPITIDPSTVSWTTTPDTTVETATVAGKQISTSVNIDFTNNDVAKNILGSKNGTVTTNSFTIDAKGAGAKTVSTPVKIALGSDLTSEQFDQLVDNNIPANEIATTTWATKPDENGNGGVVKIAFKDDAANGQPTYLNITIPSSSVDITTNADQYTPEGQQVSTKVGETPDASQGISNKNTLPDGTQYTWQTTPDTTTPGEKPAVVVVTYPDGSQDNVPTNVVVNANPEIKPISTTVGQVPEATQGIANLNNDGSTPVEGYPSGANWITAPDTSKPGTTTGTAKVTYPDGTTETVTIPVAVSDNQDVTIIDDKGHSYSLHAKNVITHKTSDKNIIGAPVIENFKLSYYEGGQNYSKPYIYTLNSDGTAYELTQTGDNPVGVTVNAPQSVPVSEISSIWTPMGAEFGIPGVTGQGQPSSLVSDKNNGTKTITYTGQDNTQGSPYVYPMYSATVDTSKVNWPIFGKGPKAQHPFPFVYIYGAEANGTIPSVNSDVNDLKAALGDAGKLVNTSDLTQAHNSEISSIDWQTLPSLEKANAQAPATVRINFTDGSYLDVPVAVNVIKVDQGVDNKDNHDIYRDITRTITVEGQDAPVVQHVIYSRAKITNLAKPEGQQVTYTAWVAGKNNEGQEVTSFPQFEVTKPGYTATATGATIENINGKQYVPASATITPDSQNETVNVTYTANEHTLVITYVDSQTGKQVGSHYNVSGKTGQEVSVDVAGNVPTNWKLVPNQRVISSYTFGSDDPAPVTYKVEHNTENVPVDKTNSDTYREVTQTIYEVPAGKTEADKTVVRTITVPFQRTGIKDLVTGDITWNAWQGPKDSKLVNGVSTYEIPAYTVAQAKGYDSYVNGSKSTEIASTAVNADSANITDTITYVKEGSTPVPYNPGKEGVNDDMNRYVTRTIVVNNPDGTKVTKNQTVHFTNKDKDGNSGYQDPVTGEITYNAAWHVAGDLNASTGTWDAYTPEVIKGYVANPASVAEKTVNAETQNQTVTINYTKNTPAETDADKYTPEGQDVHTIVGKVPAAKEGISNTGDLPEGTTYTWKTTPDVSKSGTVTGTVIVTYPDHSTDEVPVNVIVTDNQTPVPYNPGKDGVNDEMNRYVTRTIIVDNLDGTKTTTNQTVHFTNEDKDGNSGYKDVATGKVIYNTVWHVAGDLNASTGTWNAFTPKAVKGYVATPASIAAETVNANTPNQTVTISYHKDSDEPIKWNGTNDDMYREVTRTIISHIPNADPQTQIQTVKFTRKDKEGNAGYKDPATNKITWNAWHVVDGTNTTGTWAEYNAPEVKGYTADPVSVAQATVTPDTKDITVDINYTPSATTPTDADKYMPKGQDITVKQGETPDPSDGIKNKGDLPDGTKYTWKDTPDTTIPGDKPAVIVVTYPDGSKDKVPVTIHVTNPTMPTDADKYTPSYPEVVTTPGQTTKTDVTYNGDKPAAGDVTYKIVPGSNVPDWVTVDPATGTITAKVPSDATTQVVTVPVTVTYTDGSSDAITATIVVVATKDHVTNPTGPTDTIKDPEKLPSGTKVVWTPGDQPDPNKKGDQPTSVTITVPGHEPIKIPTSVDYNNPTDADKYTPEGNPITITKGDKVPDPADGIKNKGDLPDGTKYTWDVTPDPEKVGTQTVVVNVNYPDGSQDKVTTTVTVTEPTTDADKYTPEAQPITTPEGKVPDAAEGIKNKSDLPDGTKYTWNDPDKVAQDVKTPGTHDETITINYPDGSKDTVTVAVHVPAPEGQEITTDQGKLPNPADAIKNKDQMPDGTTYTWQQKPDVSTPGDHTGVVAVHFPDGTSYEITVTVHVNATTPDNSKTNNGGNTNTGTGKQITNAGSKTNTTISNNVSATENVNSNLQNVAANTNEQTTKKALPQTGNDTNKTASLVGLGLASIASMFGFSGTLRRRNTGK